MEEIENDVGRFLKRENLIPDYTMHPDEPFYILAINIETNENIARYNINAIDNYIRRTYTAEEIADNYEGCVKATLTAILIQISDELRNRDINSWGNINERYENVHDSSVNISLRNSYEQIKALNAGGRKHIRIQNIRSYYNICEMNYRIALSQIAGIIQSIKFFLLNDDKIDDVLPDDYNYYDYLKDMLAMIDHCISNLETIKQKIENLAKIRYVIEYIYNAQQFVTSVADNEFNVLCEIWWRIHSRVTTIPDRATADAEQAKMLDMFSSEILSVYNSEKPDKVECVSGRVSALIGCLETFDDCVKINCVPALRIHMVQNRAPKLIDTARLAYSASGSKEAAEVELYLCNEEVPDVVNYIREYVVLHLREEFSELLSPYHFELFLSEILQEI